VSAFADRLKRAEGNLKATREPVKHPAGWDPGVDTARETITYRASAKPSAIAHDWDHILADYGLDPETFMVLDDTVQVRSWDTNAGRDPDTGEVTIERLYYYRATIVRRDHHLAEQADLDAFIDRVRKRRVLKPKAIAAPAGPPRSLVVVLSDWQLGKRDGDGTEGVAMRLAALKQQVVDRADQVRRLGHNVVSLTVLCLGDLVEGCSEFYAMQTFTTELNDRQQMRAGYEMLTELLLAWAPEFDRVNVAAVGGNHGENRKDGKAYTDFGDNRDLELVEIARHALAGNEGCQHFRWWIPEDSLSLSLDVEGTIIGCAHGHQAGRTSAPSGENAVKVRAWWWKQMKGRRNVADAHVLVSGHFHYFEHQENDRIHLQAPALDGGSDWYSEANGVDAKPGVLTFVTGYDPQVDPRPMHVDEVKVLVATPDDWQT
jgi:predicted phosphodiesterase